MMNKRNKGSRLFTVLALMLFGLAVFMGAFWFLLPYKDFERRIEVELAKRGIEAEVVGLSPRTPFHYVIDKVHVGAMYGSPVDITLTDNKISLSLSGIFSGKLGVKADAGIFGGRLEVSTVVPSPESLSFSWKDLDVAPLGETFWENGYPLKGRTTGSGAVAMPYEALNKADMNMEADLKDLAVGPIKVLALKFEPVTFGQGRLRASIKGGKLRLYDLKFSGGDVDLSGEASVTIATPFKRSPLEAAVDFRPSPKTARDLYIPLAVLAPYKGADGSYNLKLRGTLGSPNPLQH